MDAEGIQFADEVRIACGRALASLGMGNQDLAIERISALCGRAEKIVHGAAMKQEVADEGRYNLGALKVDLRNEDSEAGED